MKILQVNKFFYARGGAERYFLDLLELLPEIGHETAPFSMHHRRNLESEYSEYFVSHIDYRGDAGLMERALMAWRTIYNREAREKIGRLVERFHPDIVHLHNIHHQITGSIIGELKRRGVPMVQTLHDYQWVCPVYTFLRRGKVCEACLGARYFQAVKHRCQDGSWTRSMVAAAELELAKRRQWRDDVDLFLAPSKFLAGKMVEHGMPEAKVRQHNYSLCGKAAAAGGEVREGALYAGRLSHEKGLLTLLEALTRVPQVTLRIAGTGPMEPDIRRFVETRGLAARVQFLGHLGEADLDHAVRRAKFVVVPSEWYENQPFAVLEAFASGTPVVGSRIGGIPELVREGETGFLFSPGSADELAEALNNAAESRRLPELGAAARDWVAKEFDPTEHAKSLSRIYRELTA